MGGDSAAIESTTPSYPSVDWTCLDEEYLKKRHRTYQSALFDSTHWDDWKPRDTDVIVATAYKSGTTWMQQIINSLVFKGEDPPGNQAISDISPWVDMRVPPREVKMPSVEAQTHRRVLKCHLPSDAQPIYPEVKYIYVGRDGRDAFMSLANHWKSGNDNFYAGINGAPGRVGPPMPRWTDFPGLDESKWFDLWLTKGWSTLPWEEDGWPFWSLFTNMESWWHLRGLPNVLFVHFNNLKQDLPGEMRRIAQFLQIPIDEAIFDKQVERCTFEWMKKNGDKMAPGGGAFWGKDAKEGGKVFINKGTNGRWRDVLTPEQVAAYEAKAAALPESCGHWLATGEFLPGDIGAKLVEGKYKAPAEGGAKDGSSKLFKPLAGPIALTWPFDVCASCNGRPTSSKSSKSSSK
ncbi:unnamed protein product [Vitrella brassicaformis CCMP3155]|uniref:Sulfotransferase domain-containing protein n=2 Tax=Vitrella brassicaformis TaxID=1169539 RepID=A0A0G4EPW9_VITBC|nr:unnamed protein product [Vitrella brassicaformis CCMP3155]|mmetsp:Transcript_29914/g.74336  ORF Transcript_29914/g.74336 Transcript_29914/m.74336 type:complete len:405 (+) Transcript_29914:146-1360(+)|eukprot:CEL99325.1 unnamed protein product [Vitrella brassicaformis CCMP3155]